MKVLIVAATAAEVAPLTGGGAPTVRNIYPYRGMDHADILITGVGMVPTVHSMMSTDLKAYDLLINIGICGSFRRDMNVGEVVQVTQDRFGDIGAEDGDAFIDIFEMGLAKSDEIPFSSGWISAEGSDIFPLVKELKKVKSITVGKVLGNAASIAAITEKYAPDVESMEGAAFMYVCKMEGVPFLQLRGISNYVEPRNKDSWDIPLAIKNVNDFTADFLEVMKNYTNFEQK